jgi:hypothetical protein
MKVAVLALTLFSTFASSAIPEMRPHVPTWETLLIRLDVRNLVTGNNEGQVAATELAKVIEGANRHWIQCSIQFAPRSFDNVNVLPLDIPFEPQSQADLAKIAAALNPNGYKGAIPFTVAGQWRINDGGFTLYGLGWVFVNGNGELNRIGAMVDAKNLKKEWIGQLAAHELGHALSLNHDPREDNVMAGGPKIAPEQCEQARAFAQGTLATFLEKGPVRASIQTPKDTI